jgi:membrane-bound lytic murein transglycosylase B
VLICQVFLSACASTFASHNDWADLDARYRWSVASLLVLVAAAVAGLLPAPAAPAPDAPLPRGPAAKARALEEATVALWDGIDAWRADGGAEAPREVALWALYQQRVYLKLGRRPALADATLALLPQPLRGRARSIVRARQALGRLHQPTDRPLRSFRAGRAEPADRLLAHYREAQRRFGVDWHVLAAVNFVETGFDRIRSPSSAGAQGPMQFMPATWRAYGLGGDVHDPHDAILGAANYLHASGAPRDYRRALNAYNRSSLYVDAVLRYARLMSADIRAYYAFYHWQVFVHTAAGPERLTGPGLDD